MAVVRRILSTVLVVVGAVAIVAGTLTWWVDRHLFDTEQFSKTSSEILHDPDAQALLAREISARVMSSISREELKAPTEVLIKQLVADEHSIALMDQGIRQAHGTLVDGTTEQVVLSLDALATDLRERAVRTAPELDSQLPPANGFLTFTLVERSDLPSVYEVATRFHRSSVALLALGAALLALGIVIGPSRWLLVVIAGLTVAVLGVVSTVVVRGALNEARRRIDDPIEFAAVDRSLKIVFDSLTKQSVVMAVAGGIALLLGVSFRLIRPEYVAPRDPWDRPSRR